MSAPLHSILECLAAKRAARVQIAAPFIAQLKEAQTTHDAAVADVDKEIAALEIAAVDYAKEHKGELFAKAKSYSYADSVLKLTTGKAVACDVDEKEVLQNLVDEVDAEHRNATNEVVMKLRAVALQLRDRNQTTTADTVEECVQALSREPSGDSMSAAGCFEVKHSLNKRFVQSLWNRFSTWFIARGLRVVATENVTLTPAD